MRFLCGQRLACVLSNHFKEYNLSSPVFVGVYPLRNIATAMQRANISYPLAAPVIYLVLSLTRELPVLTVTAQSVSSLLDAVVSVAIARDVCASVRRCICMSSIPLRCGCEDSARWCHRSVTMHTTVCCGWARGAMWFRYIQTVDCRFFSCFNFLLFVCLSASLCVCVW